MTGTMIMILELISEDALEIRLIRTMIAIIILITDLIVPGGVGVF